ncbi:MAG: hypothetical protein IPP07_10395 [Holophagales bacterium]|jgi:hypothetical protein|nr:hypothetical protein [Holophagales bacterium]MBK9965273.1 hypothetical protein [Holophagales bacterium]
MNENASTPPPPPATYAAPPVAYVPVAPAAPARPATAPGKNPAAAGLLSLFPGLGHVYLGLYKRGIVFFTIFVLLIAIADHGSSGPFGMLIPFWVIFVLIDAVRQARAINATGIPEPGFFGEEKPFKADGSLTFGIFLMLVGLFLLANKIFSIDLSFLIEWWPALLVAFGSWQVFAYFQEKKRRDEAVAEAAANEVLKA